MVKTFETSKLEPERNLVMKIYDALTKIQSNSLYNSELLIGEVGMELYKFIENVPGIPPSPNALLENSLEVWYFKIEPKKSILYSHGKGTHRISFNETIISHYEIQNNKLIFSKKSSITIKSSKLENLFYMFLPQDFQKLSMDYKTSLRIQGQQ